jgi:hypothetical protein
MRGSHTDKQRFGVPARTQPYQKASYVKVGKILAPSSNISQALVSRNLMFCKKKKIINNEEWHQVLETQP